MSNKKMATPSHEIDLTRLSALVQGKRNGRTYRIAGDEAGVAPATILRIENKVPIDLERFVKICRWLGATPETFFLNFPKKEIQQSSLVFTSALPETTPTQIETRLLADDLLTPEEVGNITNMVKWAYRKALEDKVTSKKKSAKKGA